MGVGFNPVEKGGNQDIVNLLLTQMLEGVIKPFLQQNPSIIHQEDVIGERPATIGRSVGVHVKKFLFLVITE